MDTVAFPRLKHVWPLDMLATVLLAVLAAAHSSSSGSMMVFPNGMAAPGLDKYTYNFAIPAMVTTPKGKVPNVPGPPTPP